jgi:phthiocerol/phenolphthiocerol synthesis type-I polyketide synthase C
MLKKTRAVLAEAAVVGVSCRLPGAHSVEQYWSLLREGRNSVRSRPTGRWSVERFLRAGDPEPGFTYTFAGGYLDDPFAFDPAPFGISPRESQQMDPQQRILLELTWHALEDAGIAPLSLAGRNVGVYIGASMVDYQSGASHDPAVMESHFMTGNSLSILSNRISYAFDLHGPSFTLDSACSSSFVAVNQAMAALRDGEIDMAVVGGVNLLLSPAPFIGFSQARMLSPTGLSRPFSQDADGYVRSEGGVVFVLRRLDDAVAAGNRIRSVLVGSATNSDGRTSGISLPSLDGQRRLIEGLYADLALDPDRLAFVEAHGTGTKVGDPIEARAIGMALGQHRKTVLPIGSAKSNIGHLEAASGLAGLLKSTLALDRHELPPSLFLDQVNTGIDFEGLNLAPNVGLRTLDARDDAPHMASVCNYGFGGTNAHVVLRAPSRKEREAGGKPHQHLHAVSALSGAPDHDPALLLITAATVPALQAKAGAIAGRLRAGEAAGVLASALGHQQGLMKARLALPLGEGGTPLEALELYARDGEAKGVEQAQAQAETVGIGFVFSGNGSQFPEMGQAAYRENPTFRAEFDAIDALFEPLAGWSLRDAISRPIPAEDLARTSVSQPMIYAIQSALASVLRSYGIRPAVVLGHSVGEVAAAESAGILSREEAVHLIFHRSRHQEGVRGKGRMLVVAANPDTVQAELVAGAFTGIEIAAMNAPTSTTVSGPAETLNAFSRHCRKHRLATVALDIDYPFHSAILDPFRDGMLADLATISPRAGDIPFASSVTGEIEPGEALEGVYWWNNIRQPVRFEAALRAAIPHVTGGFIEISPRAILTGPIMEVIRAEGHALEAMPSLSNKHEPGLDPVGGTLARLIVSGAAFDREATFGKPSSAIDLPLYPFQHQDYNLPATHEALLAYGRMWHSTDRHPLLGARMADGSPEWRNLLDIALVPYLTDHRVDGGVIVPAAGLIEMALAAGRDLFGSVPLELAEFDITRALAIAEDETREVSTRYAEANSTVEIWSRKRFSAQEWVLHARGTVEPARRAPGKPLAPPVAAETVHDTARAVYEEATRAGLEYGHHFALVTESCRDAVTTDSQLAPPDARGLGAYADLHVVSPLSLDAAFHGLFISRPQKEGEKKAHLPVRFRRIELFKHGAVVARTITLLTHETDRFKTVAINLFDAAGEMIASIEAAVLQALMLSRATIADRTFHLARLPFTTETLVLPPAITAAPTEVAPAWLVVRAFSVALAHRLAIGLAPDGIFDPGALVGAGRVPAASRLRLEAARIVLEGFGLIENERLRPDCPLPPPEAILTTLMTNFPGATLELRLAGQLLGHASDLIAQGKALSPSPSMLEEVESSALLARGALEQLREKAAKLSILARRPLRVLLAAPWNTGAIRALQPLVEAGAVELTLIAANRKQIDTARAMGRYSPRFEYLDLELASAMATPLAYDMLVGVGATILSDVQTALVRKDGVVALVSPGADATLDFLCGFWTGWLEPAEAHEARLARAPSREAMLATLRHAGVTDMTTEIATDGLGALLCGRIDTRKAANVQHAFLLCAPAAGPFGAELSSVAASTVGPEDASAALAADGAPAHLVYAVEPFGADARENVARHIETLKSIAEALDAGENAARVTVLTQGAIEDSGTPSPLGAAMRGFLRVAINEFPNVDFRLVDADSTLTAPALGDRVVEALSFTGEELELALTTSGIDALRVHRGLFVPQPLAEGEKAVLRFEHPGRLDSFDWVAADRKAPAEGEIEIEVAAVGLNYRDLLVGLGILDDDLLGAGLTAAALGFECSGIVTRVGAGVTALRPGDAVMGFAANTFASHLVSPAWHFFKVPAGVSLEAAATIPVAFATAWFSLLKRAAIGKGDDVLIHGGAGGVGLAAIQIARRAGARVIATASSPARRAIARAAGADLTYDSRHNRFVEAIRQELGGVDVVLNSLAGEAMEASFHLVKPFGRFVELGKRDYLDNTRLGLRPFVRNIAYFGVDLDELLAHDRRYVEAMMAEMSALFADGSLKPLPHRVFEAHEVGTAFRLMQASEHIGKIVVRPARRAVKNAEKPAFAARKDGAYLVIGGLGGLGFATARWLAGKGAGTIVLASRRGVIESGLEGELDVMRASGATVLAEALDVTDRAAVAALVARIAREHAPVRGVIHAAVLLDDGMISSLDPQRMRSALAAKIDGAINLDAALDEQPLDFFVVYSSATTVIGSPGQGVYVAANSWLEGFARARRQRGKPALAIGWGAISDVGIIARNKDLGRRLKRTTGVVGISSTESLAHLGRLLVLGNSVPAMQFYTNIAPGAAAEKLRLINSPAFTGLGLARRDEGGTDGGDLLSAIEGKSPAQAIDIIVRALKREVSHILRMPEEQIDTARPLAELGLDSLMALELQLAIERLAGTDVPMVGAGDRKLADLAGLILSGLGGASEPAAGGDLVSALSAQHNVGTLSDEQVAALTTRTKSAAE